MSRPYRRRRPLTDRCECGHTAGEHDVFMACTVDGCPCTTFRDEVTR